MTLSLRQMRYFRTALKSGSIAQAADELNVAASAISAAIDKIEGHFGIKLVNRVRSRGISATASGKLMERKFARLLEEYDSVMADGVDLTQTLKGELRLGYYAPTAPAFLPEILGGLTGPDFEVSFHLEECDNDTAQEKLLDGHLDAILFVSDAALPQVQFDVLIEAPAYCLLPADHRLGAASSVSLRDLTGETVIVLNRPFAIDYYRRLFDVAGQALPILAYANSTELVRSMVGAGHGCAVLNMLPVKNISYAGDLLKALPITDPLPPLSLSLGYDKDNPRRLVSDFADLCRGYFESGAGQRHIVMV